MGPGLDREGPEQRFKRKSVFTKQLEKPLARTEKANNDLPPTVTRQGQDPAAAGEEAW